MRTSIGQKPCRSPYMPFPENTVEFFSLQPFWKMFEQTDVRIEQVENAIRRVVDWKCMK